MDFLLKCTSEGIIAINICCASDFNVLCRKTYMMILSSQHGNDIWRCALFPHLTSKPADGNAGLVLSLRPELRSQLLVVYRDITMARKGGGLLAERVAFRSHTNEPQWQPRVFTREFFMAGNTCKASLVSCWLCNENNKYHDAFVLTDLQDEMFHPRPGNL